MILELSEDAGLLCSGIAEYGRARIAEHAAAWDEARALPETLAAELGEQGLLGLCAPEASGGLELPLGDALAVIETLAAFDGSVALTVMVHNLLGLTALARADRLVAAQVDGEALVGFADTDDASAPLRAVRHSGGWTLQGAKTRAFLPTTASLLVVTATLDDGTQNLFAVPADAAGVQPTRLETLGTRAADLGTASFEAAALTEVDDLGPADAGASTAVLAAGFAAIANGLSTAALRDAVRYANEREQFGSPIAKFQAIQWMLADLATGRDAARLMVGLAANAGPDKLRAATAAAVKACAVAVKGCSDALQIHGGYGYTKEFAVERLLRNARTCAAYVGGAQARQAVAAAVTERFTQRG